VNDTTEMIATYRKLLTWFAESHPRGSQTSNWDRWLPRAIEETLGLGISVDTATGALQYLRRRGFIETRDGTGSFLGAKVTTITDRGYRYLDRINGEAVYDADVFVAAVHALVAALRESSAANAEQIARLEDVLDELQSSPSISERAVAGLNSVAATIQTAGAAIPAWNSLVAIASALGVHGLQPVIAHSP
jgi:DNA-binding transcriptional regulator YhcF (GntR family)